MRKSLYILLSIFLLMTAATCEKAAAQKFVPTPVKVSSEKVNIQGKIFYIHRVLKGQTLFSIAKAYKVTQYDINAANPALKDGLKSEMILYIPDTAQKETVQKAEETAVKETENGQEQAETQSVQKRKEEKTVDRKQEEQSRREKKWAERRAREAERLKENERARVEAREKREAERLKEKQEAELLEKIVEQEREEKERKEAGDRKYRKHNVRWYETLNDIAVKYNVTVESICLLNNLRNVSASRPKVKTLLIPDREFIRNMHRKPETEPQTQKTGKPVVATETRESHKKIRNVHQVEKPVQKPVVKSEETETEEPVFAEHYEITLILPFNASRNTDQLQTSVADFYSGALLAVKDLKEAGLFDRFTVNVIDISQYNSAWELISTGVLDHTSLIVGPFVERYLQPIAAYANNHNIPIVSPLDITTKKLARNNPNFFLFPPNPHLSLDHQMDKIQKRDDEQVEESVLVIHEKGYEYSEIMTTTVAKLQERKIPYRTFQYNLLEGRGMDTVMRHQLDSARLNKVIIPSLNEAFVSDALRNLYLNKSVHGYRIEVFGMSKWKGSETMDVDYFHKLDLHLAVSYFIDYNRPQTVAFIKEYREAFNTEPSPFSYQGYDILTYFTRAINRYGNAFPKRIVNRRASLLQSDILFLPVGEGSGFENCALRDISYRSGWIIRQD